MEELLRPWPRAAAVVGMDIHVQKGSPLANPVSGRKLGVREVSLICAISARAALLGRMHNARRSAPEQRQARGARSAVGTWTPVAALGARLALRPAGSLEPATGCRPCVQSSTEGLLANPAFGINLVAVTLRPLLTSTDKAVRLTAPSVHRRTFRMYNAGHRGSTTSILRHPCQTSTTFLW